MTLRILIVDDDEDDRDLFCTVVEQIVPSVQCRQAKDGEEALALLRSAKVYRPDFIFLDLNMPRVSGNQCLRELKKSKELSHIPVVIYTSSKWEKDKTETAMLGAAHFITKPANLSDLYKSLSFVLGKKIEKVAH